MKTESKISKGEMKVWLYLNDETRLHVDCGMNRNKIYIYKCSVRLQIKSNHSDKWVLKYSDAYRFLPENWKDLIRNEMLQYIEVVEY